MFEILFRPEVEADLRAVGSAERKRVWTAIERRLTREPVRYGRPLGGPLAGLRRIRVGDVRIAYQVRAGRVVIRAILPRELVYDRLVRRFQRER